VWVDPRRGFNVDLDAGPGGSIGWILGVAGGVTALACCACRCARRSSCSSSGGGGVGSDDAALKKEEDSSNRGNSSLRRNVQGMSSPSPSQRRLLPPPDLDNHVLSISIQPAQTPKEKVAKAADEARRGADGEGGEETVVADASGGGSGGVLCEGEGYGQLYHLLSEKNRVQTSLTGHRRQKEGPGYGLDKDGSMGKKKGQKKGRRSDDKKARSPADEDNDENNDADVIERGLLTSGYYARSGGDSFAAAGPTGSSSGGGGGGDPRSGHSPSWIALTIDTAGPTRNDGDDDDDACGNVAGVLGSGMFGAAAATARSPKSPKSPKKSPMSKSPGSPGSAGSSPGSPLHAAARGALHVFKHVGGAAVRWGCTR
jgi:hypothetical protein